MKHVLIILALCGSLAAQVTATGTVTASGTVATVFGILDACSPGQRGNTVDVVRCESFETSTPFLHYNGSSVLAGLFPRNSDSSYAFLLQSTTVAASGNDSLNIVIPSIAPADPSGAYVANFTNDLSFKVGDVTESDPTEVYIQWREKQDAGALAPIWDGRKLIDVAVGTYSIGGTDPGSCDGTSGLEWVLTSTAGGEGVGIDPNVRPAGYNRCTSNGSAINNEIEGSGAHANYFSEQNRFALHCYTEHNTFTSDKTQCFNYVANDFSTYEAHIKIGTWSTDGSNHADSQVQVWAALDGANPTLYIDQSNVPMVNQDAVAGARLGKVWLESYTTARPGAANPLGLTVATNNGDGTTSYTVTTPTFPGARYVGAGFASIVVTGFVNAGNNGTFPVVSTVPASGGSNVTSVKVTNSGGVNETHAGSAVMSYPLGNIWYDDLIISKKFIPFPSQTTPHPPTNLTASAIGSTSVTLTWEENNTSNSGGYVVQKCASTLAQCDFGDVAFSTVTTTAAHTVTYTVTGLTASTGYVFRVNDASDATATANEIAVTTTVATTFAAGFNDLGVNSVLSTTLCPTPQQLGDAAGCTKDVSAGTPGACINYNSVYGTQAPASFESARCQDVVTSWSGGFLVPAAAPELWMHGGGHSSTGGNEFYKLAVNTSTGVGTMSRVNLPTVPGVGNCTNFGSLGSNAIPMGSPTGTCTVPTGPPNATVGPNSIHSYDGMAYIPTLSNGHRGMIRGGGSCASGSGSCSSGAQNFWIYDLDDQSVNNGWTWLNVTYTPLSGPSPFDPSATHLFYYSGVVYVVTAQEIGTLTSINMATATATFTVYGGGNGVTWDNMGDVGTADFMALDELHSQFVYFRRNGLHPGVYTQPLPPFTYCNGSTCWTQLTTTNTCGGLPDGNAAQWDTDFGKVRIYNIDNGAAPLVSWLFDPTNNSCAATTFTGPTYPGSGTQPVTNGINVQGPYGRFRRIAPYEWLLYIDPAQHGWVLCTNSAGC